MSIQAMVLRPVAGIAKRLLTSSTEPTRIYGGRARGLLLPPAIATKYLRMVLGNYEPEMQAILAEHCRSGMVAYDLGAHVGFMTLLLARLVTPGGRVHSFEPATTEATLVEAAAQLNGMDEFVSVHRIAICDEVGELRFDQGSFTGILEKAIEHQTARGTHASVTVPAMTLDHFVYHLGHEPPDFIKVDVESAEPLVMAGARDVLAREKPKLLVEVHGPTACRETLQALLEHGYRITWLQAPRGEGTVTAADQMKKGFRRGHWTQHVLALPRQ